MPGPVYRDSLGKCDAPSMLYDTIRNPNAPYVRPQVQVSSADTIESTQQRLNREVFERFKVDARLTSDSFVTVVQVGKYVFMAVMLPPYLCLYGIPKWFLISALPHMFFFIKMQSLTVGRFVQELAKRMKDLMKGLMEQMIGDALKMMRRQAKNIFQSMGKGIAKLMSASEYAWNLMQQHAKVLREACLRPFQEMYDRGANALQKGLKWTRDKSSNLANALQQRASNALHAMQAIIPPSLSWLKPSLAFMNSSLMSTTQRMASMAKTFANRAKRVLEPISNALRSTLQEAVKRIGRPWQIVSEPLLEKLEVASAALKKAVDRSVYYVSEISRHTASKVHDFVAPKMEAMVQRLQFIPNLIVQTGYIMWGLIPNYIRGRSRSNKNGERKSGSSLKRMSAAFTAGVSGLVQGVDKGVVQPVRKWVQWMREQLRHGLKWLRQQLIDFPQKVKHGLIRFWQHSKHTSSRIIYGLRLFFAWIKLIVTHGMMLVRELNDEIANWISFNRK